VADFERETIFWTSTRPGYNDRDRQKVTFVDGKRVVERVPQRGHQGDYENRRPARGIRSVDVVRHDGHRVHCCVTNGAAHLDDNTEWAQYMRAKWRYFGWYPIGSCPLALVLTGTMRKSHFVDQSLLSERPCEHGTFSVDKPCKHALAEWRARQKQQAAVMDEVEKNFRDPNEKIVDATREQTQAIVGAVTAALKGRKGSAD
jgi:hypothetical protein